MYIFRRFHIYEGKGIKYQKVIDTAHFPESAFSHATNPFATIGDKELRPVYVQAANSFMKNHVPHYHCSHNSPPYFICQPL
jgi:hypothetical protein